jgi:very-short-patch-repair endonuclease
MEYYTYNESREYLKQFNIKSSYQFYRMVKSKSFDEKINKRPYEFFNSKKRNSWISWEDFLSFSREEENENKYLNFEEARKFIRNQNIKSQKEWIKWCKNNDMIKLKIPSNPQKVFKNKGWISLSDWLGNESYKNMTNINYLNYEECKSYIKSNFKEIKNRVNWLSFDKSKLPLFIPKRPDSIYKKTGDWINWETFLDSDISPRSKSKLFLPYKKAKEYVQSLNFKDQYEFLIYINENDINFIPKRPDYVYRKYWKGFIDFLGCENNRESIGERLIKEYLDNNKINYEQEKIFKSCRNINPLPFDFYLPDYKICIEYDGELHYKVVEHFGGEKKLKMQKNNDKIKTDWCLLNNIELLRIPYNKKKKISEILKKELYL